ncbi:MAG: Hint domain-containing protein [Rubellimicrobium sp.]|nr:Hint domain-containing protein [Rubellimicrobium sp.]
MAIRFNPRTPGDDTIAGGGEDDSIEGEGEDGSGRDPLDLSAPDRHSDRLTQDGAESGTVRFLDGDGAAIGAIRLSGIERVIEAPSCLTPGTLIATGQGEVAVEDMRPGDPVLTRDNGLCPPLWIGRRDLSAAEVAAQPDLAAVRVAAGALGPGQPAAELVVSPQHRILISDPRAELWFGAHEVLVPAIHLVGRPGITRTRPGAVSYIHLLFARHEVILSNGAWSESFQPGHRTLDAMDHAPREELNRLFPQLRGGAPYPAARMTLRRRESVLLFGAKPAGA